MATDISKTIQEIAPNLSTKVLKVETEATADADDTVCITLADYGIKTVEAIKGFIHSTTDSIIIEEAPTTAVSGGVLTITLTGSTDNKKRVYLVYGDSA